MTARRTRLILGILVSLGAATPLLGQLTDRLSIETRAAEVDTTGVSLLIALESSLLPGLAGFSFGLVHDTSRLELAGLDTLLSIQDPEFLQVNVPQPGTPFAALGVVFSLTPPIVTLPPGSFTVARVRYDVPQAAPPGLATVEFGAVGSPLVQVTFSDVGGTEITPTLIEDGGVVVLEPIPAGNIDHRVWLPATDDTLTIVDAATVNSTSFATPAGSLPSDIAVAANGLGWVCFPGAGTIQRYLSDGTPFGNAITATPSPRAIAIDGSGNAWVTDEMTGTLVKISGSGLPLLADNGALGSSIAVGASPRGIAADPIGNVWIAVSGADQLQKRDPLGALALVVDYPPGSEPTGVTLDRNGIVWITLKGSDRVERRGSDGSLIETFDLPFGSAPEGIAIRGADEAWVAADLPFRLLSGAPPDPIDDPGTPDPTGIAIDGVATVWISDAMGLATRFASDGTILGTTSIGLGSAFLGDATGIQQANVLRPTSDLDGDGFASRLELDLGTNPFDDLSAPPATPVVVDLQCLVDADVATVSWTNLVAYDQIEVLRDGVPVAGSPFSGTTTSVIEPNLAIGTAEYSVTGSIATISSDPTLCTIVIGSGAVESINPIGVEIGDRATNLFDVAVDPDPRPGEPTIYATDAASGKIYALDANYFVLSIIESPFIGAIPSRGIAFRPDGHGGLGSLYVASGGDETEPSRIAEITLGGVVIEPTEGGAGIFALSGAMGPLMGPLGGISFGVNSSTIVGVEPTGCLIFRTPPGSGVLDFSFAHPNPGPGLNGVVHSGLDTQESFQIYVTSFDPIAESTTIDLLTVEFDGLTTTVDETGVSLPLIALEDSENTFGGIALSGESISLVGSTTSVIYEVSAVRTFVRGDANFDGGVDVADAITILGQLFQGLPSGNCLDASDVNDDGTRNIADAIALLDALFGGGPAIPPPTTEGFDPTEDALPCLF